MIKIVLFDFDGTIADSFTVVQNIFYEITGKPRIKDPVEIERLRKMTTLAAVRELHIRPWQIPGLLIKGRSAMAQHINDIPIFPGMVQTIRKLHADGFELYVMSSNSAQNVQDFLKHHSLDSYFLRVYGNIGLLNKAAAIRNVMRRNRFAPEECAYIGDETRDIEGAKRAGITIISVPWGYNDRGLLAHHQPDVIVSSPQEIITYLESKNKA
jgi:phosphoglycolate phosphatase